MHPLSDAQSSKRAIRSEETTSFCIDAGSCLHRQFSWVCFAKPEKPSHALQGITNQCQPPIIIPNIIPMRSMIHGLRQPAANDSPVPSLCVERDLGCPCPSGFYLVLFEGWLGMMQLPCPTERYEVCVGRVELLLKGPRPPVLHLLGQHSQGPPLRDIKMPRLITCIIHHLMHERSNFFRFSSGQILTPGTILEMNSCVLNSSRAHVLSSSSMFQYCKPTSGDRAIAGQRKQIPTLTPPFQLLLNCQSIL